MNLDSKQLAQFEIACSILDSLDEEYSDESWIVNQFRDGRNCIQRDGGVANWQVGFGSLSSPVVASEELDFHCVSSTLYPYQAQMVRGNLDAYKSMMELRSAEAMGGLKRAVNKAFFDGLKTIISSTGTAHGVSLEDYPNWKSYEEDVTPDKFNEHIFGNAVAYIGDCGAGEPSRLAAVMHPQRMSELRKILGTRVNVPPLTGSKAPGVLTKSTFDIWGTGVTIELWPEEQCSPDTAFLIDFSKMMTIRFEPDRADWLRPPGSIQIWRLKYNSDGRPLAEYEANLYCYLSIATRQRNAHAKFNFRP